MSAILVCVVDARKSTTTLLCSDRYTSHSVLLNMFFLAYGKCLFILSSNNWSLALCICFRFDVFLSYLHHQK
jgi:hypothetical protein